MSTPSKEWTVGRLIKWYLVVIIIPLGFALTPVLYEAIVIAPPKDLPPEIVWGRVLESLTVIGIWLMSLLIAVVLLGSIFLSSGRKWWRSCHYWFTGLRPRIPFTTAKQRLATTRMLAENNRDLKRQKYDEGFAVRSAEVAEERRIAPKPSWRIEQRAYRDFLLYNSGWMVGNVLLDAPKEDFVFEGDPPVFKGNFGDNSHGGSIGKLFFGQPTEKGLAEGINFTVRWRDTNLDEHETTLQVHSKNLMHAEEHADS